MSAREVRVELGGGVALEGSLIVPEDAQGIVLFAHGSGSSRFSPRNRYVAEVLHAAGLGTLLVDLLTADEEEEERYTRHLRFDIGLLAERLVACTQWLLRQPETAHLPIGYFGSSTGAGAALVATSRQPGPIGAVVSRGGRPDLAARSLASVTAPTLLIVGGADTEVIALNRQALAQLPSEKRLEIVPGATHLFEEPGALQRVAALAGDWFVQHLATRPGEERGAPA